MASFSVRRRVATALAVFGLFAAVGLAVASPASADICPDVHVVFARGTLEPGGPGILVGESFISAVKAGLIGRNVDSYGVNYAADVLQTSAGSGATDMTNNVTTVAALCPNTKFILGGYSQGATVTDIALGIPTILGSGNSIPVWLAGRVSAVVVFGNPLAIFGGHIPTSSLLYGLKSKEFCNSGDPVCANGVNVLAHLTYGFDGSTAAGGKWAADKVLWG
jgi:cutinase